MDKDTELLVSLPENITREDLEKIEREFFPEWFETCHLPIQEKPEWLRKLWENLL